MISKSDIHNNFDRVIFDVKGKQELKRYKINLDAERDDPYSEDTDVMFFPDGKKFLSINGKNVHIWDISDLSAGARNAESLNP